jgi:hypothetical protein
MVPKNKEIVDRTGTAPRFDFNKHNSQINLQSKFLRQMNSQSSMKKEHNAIFSRLTKNQNSTNYNVIKDTQASSRASPARSPDLDGKGYDVVGFEAFKKLPDHSNVRIETKTSPHASKTGNYLDIAQARRKNIQ